MDSLAPHGNTERAPTHRRTIRSYRVRQAAQLCAAALLVLLPAATGRHLIKAQDLAGSLAGLAAMSEGQKLVEQGSPEAVNKGIEKLKEAAALFKKAGMKDGEAAALLNLGQAYGQLEENFKSLEYFELAAAAARDSKTPLFRATTAGALGAGYASTGQVPKAVKTFEQALSLLPTGGDKDTQNVRAFLLSALGATRVLLGEHVSGFQSLRRALALRRSLKDLPGEVQVLTAIGTSYSSVGRKEDALSHLSLALRLARSLKDPDREAHTLSSLGSVYIDVGESRKALDYYNQALAIWRAGNNREGVSRALGKIARVYQEAGDVQKALDIYEQLLRVKRESDILNNIGSAYISLGDFQKALDVYNEALALARAEGLRRGEASILANVGGFYLSLGEPQEALRYFEQALPISRAMSDPSAEAAILGNISTANMTLGRRGEALGQQLRALQLRQKVSDRSGEVMSLLNVGAAYAEMGQRQKALDQYAKALVIGREINDASGIAGALNGYGDVYLSAGEWQKARDFYGQALALVRPTGDRQKEAATLSSLARVEMASGNLIGARARIEAALAIVEELRVNVLGGRLRASYFAKVQDYYELYIEVLMRHHRLRPLEGFDVLALQASERARARTLLETLAESNADLREGVAPTVLQRERSVKERLNAWENRLVRQLAQPHTAAQIAVTRREIEGLLSEYEEIGAQIRAASPRYATLTQTPPLDLQAIRKELGRDTTLLEYSLGKERSYLSVVNADSFKSYELPGRDEIESSARRLYEFLTARNRSPDGETAEQRQARVARADSQVRTAASELARVLLPPALAHLQTSRLLVVGDGALQYVPFSILPSPTAPAEAGSQTQPPLILQHEVVTLPSASTIGVLRREVAGRRAAPKTLAVLADPVFGSDDERLRPDTGLGRATHAPSADRSLVHEGEEKTSSQLYPSFGSVRIGRLLGTRLEAERILALVPAEESLAALDFKASLKTALGPELSQYRYVHIATHGYLDSQRPELSAVVLSLVNERGEPQRGFLRAHEVYNLRLPAELVVLSACETGLGKEIKGEGLVGLTRGFMYAGAPRVVVSLWSVSDRATAELMEKFYRSMLKDGLRPAAALRAAQLEMSQQAGSESPYYWAAFTLQGEWD